MKGFLRAAPLILIAAAVLTYAYKVWPADVPRGAVIAFHSESCPNGWESFEPAEGRTVVGVTSPNKKPQGDEYKFEKMGGRERIPLTESHIPAHQHETVVALHPNHPFFGRNLAPNQDGVTGGGTVGNQQRAYTSRWGAANPIAVETMPPFVALLYCRRK